jgi:hypothetical protein
VPPRDSFRCTGCGKRVSYDALFVFKRGREPAYVVGGIPYCDPCAQVASLRLLGRETAWELVEREYLDDD